MRHLGLLALLLAALAPTAYAGQLEVQLRSGSFDPGALQVDAGSTVLFVNGDGRAHTVTSGWDGGKAFDVLLRPGHAVPLLFAEAGSYLILCVPHSTHDEGGATGMVATIDVSGAPATRASVWPVVGLVALAAIILPFVAQRAVRALPLRPARSSPR